MRQAAVNAQQRLRDQAEGETHGGVAEGLEGVGQQGKDAKRKKKETLLKGVASEDEDEGGRGRGMARGVKRGVRNGMATSSPFSHSARRARLNKNSSPPTRIFSPLGKSV